MVDAFAGVADLGSQVTESFKEWHRAVAERDLLESGAQEKLRLANLWTFQRKEIEAVAPQPGEDTRLENERRVLRNVARLEEAAGAAYSALYDAPESATAQLRVVMRRLEELGRIDESAGEI